MADMSTPLPKTPQTPDLASQLAESPEPSPKAVAGGVSLLDAPGMGTAASSSIGRELVEPVPPKFHLENGVANGSSGEISSSGGASASCSHDEYETTIAALRKQLADAEAVIAGNRTGQLQSSRYIAVMERELSQFRRLRPIHLSINKKAKHNDGFVVFEVTVDRGVVKYAVWHRYKDFRKLHDDAAKECPSAPMPKMPGRSIVGSTSSDKEKIEARRAELETYLRQFVVVDSLRDSRAFTEFVQPNQLQEGIVDGSEVFSSGPLNVNTPRESASLPRTNSGQQSAKSSESNGSQAPAQRERW